MSACQLLACRVLQGFTVTDGSRLRYDPASASASRREWIQAHPKHYKAGLCRSFNPLALYYSETQPESHLQMLLTCSVLITKNLLGLHLLEEPREQCGSWDGEDAIYNSSRSMGAGIRKCTLKISPLLAKGLSFQNTQVHATTKEKRKIILCLWHRRF